MPLWKPDRFYASVCIARQALIINTLWTGRLRVGRCKDSQAASGQLKHKLDPCTALRVAVCTQDSESCKRRIHGSYSPHD